MTKRGDTMTAKERQIRFWQREVEARFSCWKELVERKDVEGARQAKWQYVNARKMLEELEKE